MSTPCKAQTQDGQPCRMKPGASGYCFAHDPDRAAERDEARRNGGLQRSGQIALAVLDEAKAWHPKDPTPDEVCALITDTIQQVQTGRLDYRLAATVGNLASLMLRAMYVKKEWHHSWIDWWPDAPARKSRRPPPPE